MDTVVAAVICRRCPRLLCFQNLCFHVHDDDDVEGGVDAHVTTLCVHIIGKSELIDVESGTPQT